MNTGESYMAFRQPLGGEGALWLHKIEQWPEKRANNRRMEPHLSILDDLQTLVIERESLQSFT